MALLEATKYILSHVVGKLVFEMFMFLAKTLFIKKKKKEKKVSMKSVKNCLHFSKFILGEGEKQHWDLSEI